MKKILKLMAGLFMALLMTAVCSVPAEAATVRVKSTSCTGGFVPVQFIILQVIVVGGGVASCVTVKKVSKKQINRPKDYTNQIINEAILADPNFASGQLTTRAKEDFAQITNAVCNRDISLLEDRMSQELLNRQASEIESLLSQGQIHMLANITVQHAYLHLYRRDKNYEYITVCVDATMNDYVIDQNTYRVLQGNKAKELTRFYLLTYMRSKNFMAAKPKDGQQTKCPNCGAPLIVKGSRQCEYCHSIIRAELFEWVLHDVEVLGEQDHPDNRGILLEDNSDVHFTKQNSSYYTGYYDNGIDYNYKDPFSDDDYNKSF